MSVALRFDARDLAKFERVMDKLAGDDQRLLQQDIGAVLESQVRRRISDEKFGPDGTQWPGWTAEYARTRNSNHSLLEGEGELLDSIQYLVGAGSIEVGSNLIYALTHQEGDDDRGIEAREYLGLSSDNILELEGVVLAHWEGLLQ